MLRQVGELRTTLLSLRPPVLILPHVNADMDAVASALGVHTFLRHHCIASALFFPSLSASAAKLLKDLAVDYSTDLDVAGRDVVVVDTSSSSMLPVDVYPARRLVVVDHHRGGDLRGFIYDAPSLSEVVASLLLADGIRDERAYLALAAGIYSDTAGLIAATPFTLEILSKTLAAARAEALSDVIRLVSQRRTVFERIARLKALRRAKIHRFGEFVVVTSDAGAYEGGIAWEFINAGADAAFVAGKKRVVARLSDDFILRTGIDLSDIFSRVAEELGGNWGGHPAAAGMHVSHPKKALVLVLDVLADLLRRTGFSFTRRDY